MSDGRASDAVLAALRRARRHALAATELAAQVRGDGVGAYALEGALDELERDGRIVVLVHPSPDVHLDGTDLRTVGAVDDATPAAHERARAAAAAHWDDILRAFLATHRCG